MLRKIRLYGRLAKFIGKRVLEADVTTAAEAVRFLLSNFPNLEKHMADQHYRVSLGAYDLSLEELHDPAGQQEIKIIPVVVGAGGGIGKIILGVALIALSFVSFGAGAWAGIGGFGATGAWTAAGSLAAFKLGGFLVLSGVAQLLSPVPTAPTGTGSDKDPRKSFSFSGIQNTSRQGTPVPLVYGETLTGSVVVSAGIDTVQVKP